MAFGNRNNNRNRLRGMSKRQGRRRMPRRPRNLPLTNNEALEEEMRDREMMEQMQMEQAMAQGGGRPGRMSFQRRRYNPNAPQRMPNRFGMNRQGTRQPSRPMSESDYAMDNQRLVRDARMRRRQTGGRGPRRPNPRFKRAKY